MINFEVLQKKLNTHEIFEMFTFFAGFFVLCLQVPFRLIVFDQLSIHIMLKKSFFVLKFLVLVKVFTA